MADVTIYCSGGRAVGKQLLTGLVWISIRTWCVEHFYCNSCFVCIVSLGYGFLK